MAEPEESPWSAQPVCALLKVKRSEVSRALPGQKRALAPTTVESYARADRAAAGEEKRKPGHRRCSCMH